MVSVLRIAPMLFVMGAIFFISHQPGDALPEIEWDFFDKFAHFLAYGCLAVTCFFALSPRFRNKRAKSASLVVLLICGLYGLSDEYHQSFVEGRYASGGDLLFDVLGALFICILFQLYFGKNSRNKTQ